MIRRGNLATGFTIVEVMVFLAVSGALLISALTLIGGQQRNTEFNESITDIEKQLEGIVNNVSNGFYPSSKNITCDLDGSGNVVISSGPSDPGTQDKCVFLGKVISKDTNPNDVKVSSVVGRRLKNNLPATLMADANPVIATDLDVKIILKNGLKLAYIRENDTSDVVGLGVFSSLGETTIRPNNVGTSTSEVQSRGQSLDYIAIDNLVFTNSFKSNYETNKSVNPVSLCFDGSSSNLRAKIWIGKDNKGAVLTKSIESGQCL